MGEGVKNVLFKILAFLRYLPEGIGRWVYFVFSVARTFSFRRYNIKAFFCQCYEIGVSSLPVALFTGGFTGIVLSLQSYYQLGVHGLSFAIGFFVVKSMLVEVGPVLTALILAGRVGGAIAAFIGTIRMTEQACAMRTMGVNPFEYFALPRVLAGMFVTPIVSIISSWAGILSGWLLCVAGFHMRSSEYWGMVFGNIGYEDLFIILVKALLFGFVITSTSCYRGFQVNKAANEVCAVTTSAVVSSYIALIFLNSLVTIIFNMVF
ncbi:MlaE family ABC transporter permease [Chlamydiifrater phoenicopteri]|uniref:MlaE family ABC transporter permease n=1 Tax=Chlamydiifrater phoenicopteri TaxID=2681469 RepID=UPI001BCF8FDB|nr:ABC transporter permease [Chlamydiifrater phoenicopteri]